ncbi:MAG: Phosphoribosylglycinamide formyltransferase [Parcubacteria group bacterium GW2011_GWF2_38_8]|nr:MAG: Phosphoribosylglycinamide formyltransferase [Parcubacteria group bacterium GW2011_GWF2_38_8]
MEAIIKAARDGQLPKVHPALVISSSENAGGIEKAKNLGIKEENILITKPRGFEAEEDFGKAIISECRKRDVDFIGQYGWLVKTPKNVCEAYRGMIVNQHPGPLDNGRPDFGGAGMYGLRVHQARLLFVERTKHDFWTEATVHRVTANFDEGKIIKRKQIPILPGDTAETLQKRVLPAEHQVQIEVLKDFSEGKVEEFIREIPLVLSSEEKILEECKELAKKMYPKG